MKNNTFLYVALFAVFVSAFAFYYHDIERLLVRHSIIQNEAAVSRAKTHFRTTRAMPRQNPFTSINTKPRVHVPVRTASAPAQPSTSSAPAPVSQPETVPALPVVHATNENTSSYLWGVFNGWQAQNITAFETLVGKPVNIAGVFVHWGNENEFPFAFANPLKNAGKTTLIYWEAKDYTVDTVHQTAFNYDSILAGTWDTYLTSFAKDAKAFGGPVILIPFEEANGDWEAWSGVNNGNTPAKHKEAYRYVRAFFNNVPNVQFGWTMNNVSVPNTANNQHEAYYPGDAYVDYIGIDGFNFGSPWQTWDEVFGPAIKKLSVYGKPIMLTSMASAQGSAKASWISTGLGSDIKKYPSVVGWIWFNENKEKDWRVNSDASSLAAFKQITAEY